MYAVRINDKTTGYPENPLRKYSSLILPIIPKQLEMSDFYGTLP